MIVATAVIALGLLAGLLAAALVARRSSPDLDDPHLDRRVVAGWLAEH